MSDFILSEKDLLKEEHFPVTVVFNDPYIRNNFLDFAIKPISKGHGFGVNYGACIFPDDLDEYDIANGKMFEGVEFGLHDDRNVIIDYKTFYYYFKLVCNRYLKTHRKDKKEIYKALREYCDRFNVNPGDLS